MKRKLSCMLVAAILAGADLPNDDTNNKDRAKMQGNWARVSVVFDGIETRGDDAQTVFRTVKGEEYSVFRFDKLIGNGTFKIDATKNPKTIDLVPTSLKEKNQAILGIYEFDADHLKICHASPGKARPTDFTAKPESGQTLTVWEREKEKKR